MRHLVGLALAALIACAFTGTAASAAEDDAILYEYTPAGWGFSVGLTDTGELFDPGHPEWPADATVDFTWISAIEDSKIAPIYRIDGRTAHLMGDDGQEKVMTDEGFDAYYDDQLAEWTANPNLTILGGEPNYDGAGGRLWHMYHIHEESPTAGPLDYYTLVGRDDDKVLRQISFYYTMPETADEDDAILGMVMIHLDPSLMEEEQ